MKPLSQPQSTGPTPTSTPASEEESARHSVENEKPSQPPPPPNGGLQAWLQVAGAFMLFWNSWGPINAFGVFQSYYKETLLTDHSASAISWIGTTQGFLLFVVGVFAGPIFDKGYMRTLIAVGTFLVVFGLMMTSISTEYYQVFLAHGVVVGIGTGCIYLPSIAIVATYFNTRRALATGITAAGGSIGSIIYPIIFRQLIDPLGFGWTTRVLGFVALAGLGLPLLVMRTRLPPPAKTRTLFDFKAFKEPPFVIFGAGLFFSLTGLYFPFFYLPSYFSKFLHADAYLSTYSVAILNAASLFGRIIPGIVADKMGSVNTLVPISLVSTLMAFAWIGIRNVPGTIAYACVYGFASGAIVSLPATVIATTLSPDMSQVGTRMGMSFTFASLGLLIGNPIAGALLMLESEHVTFWKAQLFSACMVTMALVCFAGLRLLKWNEGSRGKL